MTALLADLFAIVSPVFLASTAGFLWVRAGQPYDAEMMGQLATLVGTPCLVFSVVSSLDLSTDILTQIVGGALISISFAFVAGFIVVRAAGLSWRTYTTPMMLSNTGNMGLPVCLFAFGAEGLALAIGYMVVMITVHLTLGVRIVSGGRGENAAIKLPILYGVVLCAAIAFPLSDATPPRWLANTTGLIGDFTIPMMLLTLGAAIASLKITHWFRSIFLSILRLALGTIGGAVAIFFLDLEGTVAGVVMIQSIMPVAVYNFVFAQRFDRDPADVASLVLVSTLFAFIYLPIALAYLLR